MKQSGDKVSAVAPTPDSQSSGPGELRKMADLADEDKLDVSWGNRMRVAADAWDETEGRLFDSHGMVMDLRERLEIAEKVKNKSRLFFVAKRVLEGALDLGDLRIAVDEHAALAGEEKP